MVTQHGLGVGGIPREPRVSETSGLGATPTYSFQHGPRALYALHSISS